MPRAGLAQDGYSDETEATATCFCGAVQMIFVRQISFIARPKDVTHPFLVMQSIAKVTDTFICHCTDCYKLTASIMGTAAFTIAGEHVRWNRGQNSLSSFGQSETVGTGNRMVTSFCKTCGTVMYRQGTGFPGVFVMRLGVVDDFNLFEGRLKPRIEQFIKDRPSYLREADGVKQYHGYYYGTARSSSSSKL